MAVALSHHQLDLKKHKQECRGESLAYNPIQMESWEFCSPSGLASRPKSPSQCLVQAQSSLQVQTTKQVNERHIDKSPSIYTNIL